jgi:hypothetical protein
LEGEEVALRRRYVGDARATAFLNEAPSEFRLQQMSVSTYDGPPPGLVEYTEQRGLDAGGRIPWHVVLDRKAANGRATSVSVSWGARPTQTIYFNNEQFPWLDLTSAEVAVKADAPHERLLLMMRYGAHRGWCGDLDQDDRSRLSVRFKPEGVEVSRRDRTNCNSSYDDLQSSAFAEPPH